jgi:hypothetical protein
MAKLNLEEFNKKWSEKLGDNEDLAIEIMEDASDSFTYEDSKDLLEETKKELESAKEELDKVNSEYLELKAKYKERFLTPVEPEVVEEVKEEIPEVEEKEVIDIKDIFD